MAHSVWYAVSTHAGPVLFPGGERRCPIDDARLADHHSGVGPSIRARRNLRGTAGVEHPHFRAVRVSPVCERVSDAL